MGELTEMTNSAYASGWEKILPPLKQLETQEDRCFKADDFVVVLDDFIANRPEDYIRKGSRGKIHQVYMADKVDDGYFVDFKLLPGGDINQSDFIVHCYRGHDYLVW